MPYPAKYTVENLDKLQEIIEKWKKETIEAPTFTSLLRYVGYKSPCSFYENMERDDEVGDTLKQAYNHIIEFHENKLTKSNNSPNSIFLIKTYRKLGWMFRDYVEDFNNPNKQTNFTFEIVEKKPNESKPSAS